MRDGIKEKIQDLSARNIERAHNVMRDTRVVEIWESIGARVNIVGSLRTGLMVKNRDIDLHIYTERLYPGESFHAMSKLAADKSIEDMMCRNLSDTDEECIKWHVMCRDADGDLWKMDMIHILGGSKYDGHFERVADRIVQALTPETREAIMELKYLMPDDLKIGGVEYYKAVLSDGVRTWDEFVEWRKDNAGRSFMQWMP